MTRPLQTSLRIFAFTAGLWILTGVSQASACPVCYGASDSPMADGVNAAIIFLLGVTGTVLSGVVAFFVYMRKRTKLTLNNGIDYPRTN